VILSRYYQGKGNTLIQKSRHENNFEVNLYRLHKMLGYNHFLVK